MFFSLHFLYFALTTVRVHFHICKGPYKGPYEWTHCSQQFWLTRAYVSPLCQSLYFWSLSPSSPNTIVDPAWTACCISYTSFRVPSPSPTDMPKHTHGWQVSVEVANRNTYMQFISLLHSVDIPTIH